MELLHADPAQIWRLLIPKERWVCPDELHANELVFVYRDQVYFVQDDGAVLSVPRPENMSLLDLDDMYDHLALSPESIDFDDLGEFDLFCVLRRMGFLVPTASLAEQHDYQIELINTTRSEVLTVGYELHAVSFPFALYHALRSCHELNRLSEGEDEYQVKSIQALAANCNGSVFH